MSNQEKDVATTADETKEIKYRGVRAMPFIIGNETFEKLGEIGASSNLLVYLTQVFNLKSITAATFLNLFEGTTNLATLGGALLCDSFFGRYNTLAFGSIATFLGLLVIALTAAIPSLHPPQCTQDPASCSGPTAGQMASLLGGCVLLVIGAGGIRPCGLAFGADQFNPNTEAGRTGIKSFFNWYFCTFAFAQMVSLTAVVYVQTNVSWAVGLGIPPLLVLISIALFFWGSRIYVRVEPEGSPLGDLSRVLVVAFKKRRLQQPQQPWVSLFNYVSPTSINSRLPHTKQFSCLDKAAIISPEDKLNPDGSAAEPWKLCTMQKVEEVKCLTRVIPIWAAAMVYYVTLALQRSYVVFQALQSDRRLPSTNFCIPAASYDVFSMLSLTALLPIYDRLLVPSLRSLTGNEGGITLLQRLGIGFFLSVAATLVSALIEEHRRSLALTRPAVGIDPKRGNISSMSAFWFIPQLVLTGVAEGFASVGEVEFYYQQFPENMRSISMSVHYLGRAVSHYLSGLLVTVIHQATKGAHTGNWLPEDLNKGRLEYLYLVVAGIGVLNLGYFILCARWYKYKGENSGEVGQEVQMHETSTCA